MKFLIMSSFLAILASCGGGGGSGGSGQPAPEFKVAYIYPDNDMTPGQGERVVQPVGVVCHDEKGQVVDDSNCPDISSIVVANGPTDVQKSPAGQMTITVPNSEEGAIAVEVGEGFALDRLADEEKKNFFQDKVTCVSTHFLDFKGNCNDEPFSLRYSEWDRSSILACDGTGTATRTSTCVDAKTGISADNQSSCTDTPVLSETQPSPFGQATKTNANGDTLVVTCAEGKTVEDVGVGTSIVEVVDCGSGRYNSGLGCSPITYAPTDFIFPENDLTAGQGERVVSATGIAICAEEHTGNPVDISLCGGFDLSEATQTQQSPAGTITVVQPSGDSITYTVGVGQTPSTEGVVGTVTSCAEDRHVVGNDCVADVFVPSSFNFPVNTLAIGAGERTVNANSFSVCTRQHNDESVAVSKCVMPTPRPTQLQLSPAGQIIKNVNFANSNPVLTLDVEEGQVVTNPEINNLIIPELAVIGCSEGYKIASSGYACQSKTYPTISYKEVYKVILPTGHVNIVPTITSPDGLTVYCERTDDTPSGINVNSNCSLTGNYLTEGDVSFSIQMSSPNSSMPSFKNNITIKIVADELWTKISPATSNNCSNYDSLNSDALIENGIMYCASSVGGFWKSANTPSSTAWTFISGAKTLAGYGLSQITTNFPKTLNNSAMSFTVTDARGVKPTISKSWTFTHGRPLNGTQADVKMNVLAVDPDGGVYVHLYYYWYTGIEGAQWNNKFIYFSSGSNTPTEVYFHSGIFNGYGLDRRGVYWSGKYVVIPSEGLMIDTTYDASSYQGYVETFPTQGHGIGIDGYHIFRDSHSNAMNYAYESDSGYSVFGPPNTSLQVRYPIMYDTDKFLIANGNIGSLDYFYIGKKPVWGSMTLASNEYLQGPTGIQGLGAVLALGLNQRDVDGETKYDPIYAFVISGKIEFWKFNPFIAEID